VKDLAAIDVAFAGSRSYFSYAAVAMESLLDAANDPSSIRVHLVSADTFAEASHAFDAITARHGAAFSGYRLDEGIPSFSELQGFTPHYHRLLIPEVLPVDIDRYIYLDCDVVVRRDITGLWNIELEHAIVGATIDYLPTVAEGISNHGALGLRGQDSYFNSGVLVVDRRAWIRADVTSDVLAATRANEDHLWALGRFPQYDQYGLNLVLRSRWRQIDAGWNYGSELAFDPSVSIVHFNGHGKPWSPTCTAEYRDEFFAIQHRLGELLDHIGA
jgi:lipopolysaccharide biosynthesis glycosyltransferase